MWTGESAVPAPPLVAPPATAPPASKYKSVRQNELEQLRQRGLAKLLNKHFTSVTQAIAEQRAAADAALRDLEARKAEGLKDWGDAKPGELSVWDSLYVELQRKKADCKRKEKETLLLYQRYVAKFGSTGVVAAPSNANVNGYPPPMSPRSNTEAPPSSSRVPFLANQIESNLDRHVSTGAERHPSIQSLGLNETYQKAFEDMDEEQRLHYLRALEGRGVDARSSTPTLPMTEKKKRSNSTARVGFPDTPVSEKQTSSFSALFGLWDSDTPGAKSHLTSTTTSTETNGAGSPISSASERSLELQDEAADEDEMGSVLSGLTSAHSLVTSDAEIKLVEFLTTETEEIRKMLDEEEDHSVRSSYSGEVGSHSALAANQAESMVLQMQQILQDYQEQCSTSLASSLDTPSREPRPYDSGNPDEQWVVYFDETYQREYYHEVKSNRSQWTPPDEVAVADFTSTSPRAARSAAPLSHLEVMPERLDLEVRPSRRDEYRRKRHRRRKRRLAASFFIMLCAIIGGLYQQYRPEVVDQAVAHVRPYLPVSLTGYLEKREMQEQKDATEKGQAALSRKAKTEEDERWKREQMEFMAKEFVRAQEAARLEAARAEEEQKAAELSKKKERRASMMKSIFGVMLQAPRPL